MKTMQDDYGMGMFEFPLGERKLFGHTGAIDAFGSMFAYFPDDSIAIAYISNGEVYSNNDIIKGVLKIYYNKPYEVPSFKTISLKTEDLDQYLGVYSSKQMPIKITITKRDTVLSAQATGQSAFPLEATEKDVFTFDAASIQLRFNPIKNELIMKQGQEFLFTKEK